MVKVLKIFIACFYSTPTNFKRQVPQKLKKFSKFIFILIGLSSFNICNGQWDLDYYGEQVAYQGDIFKTSTQYYKPIYEDGVLIEYELEPYGIVPRASKSQFDKQGRMVLFEEIDSECKSPNCLYASTAYTYENGQLIKEVKTYTNNLVEPEEKVYEYEGDSIVYRRPGFRTYKQIIRKDEIVEEASTVNGRLYKKRT